MNILLFASARGQCRWHATTMNLSSNVQFKQVDTFARDCGMSTPWMNYTLDELVEHGKEYKKLLFDEEFINSFDSMDADMAAEAFLIQGKVLLETFERLVQAGQAAAASQHLSVQKAHLKRFMGLMIGEEKVDKMIDDQSF